jgi:hypothetical protein
MAELNKSVLGKVRGTIGDLTFRQRNGKNIISTRPSSFMPGTDPASIARRNRFKLASKIAKEINSIEIFKEPWKLSTPSGLIPFNYIFKTNYPLIGENNIVSNLKIFPTLGFNASNQSTTFNATDVDVTLDALGTNTGIDSVNETSLSLISVIYLSEPINPTSEEEHFIIVKSENIPLQLVDPLTFTITIPDNQISFYDEYSSKKSFSTLITTDSLDKLVKSSNTITS